jgi:hypothetical protein
MFVSGKFMKIQTHFFQKTLFEHSSPTEHSQGGSKFRYRTDKILTARLTKRVDRHFARAGLPNAS